ncbi:MAG: UDP-N-acetylmuramoyl-tripeptide--D-alanyl-D-alanine ligase, partial [Cyclobacteriaceae bacterium]|nr:UDP-N-acetylmuramoyl-tripeptide--D-alanyl-D-alanine ligase [Cyclobacteriaceae bacterium]
EAYLCGPLMSGAKKTFPTGKFFDSKKELIESLKNNPIQHATILVKASRGMKMEEVVEAL